MSGRNTAAAALLLACLVPAAGRAQEEEPAGSRAGLRPVPPVAGEIEGMIDADRQQLEEARAAFDEVLAEPGASDHQVAQAYGRLGQIYYAYALNELAEVCFTNAAALEPDVFRPHYYLGAIYATSGELEKAKAELMRARGLQTDGPTLIRLGRVHLDLQELDEAEEAFRAALELDPGSAAAYEGLGKARYEQGRPEDAIEYLQHALELQPEATSLHYLLGLAYRKLGDLEEAKRHLALNRSVEVLFPDPLVTNLNNLLKGSRLHLKAGNRALEDGDFETAVMWFRRAVKADPNDKLAQNNLGYSLAELGKRGEAVQYFHKALELDPEYVIARLNLAAALLSDGNYAAAAEEYHKVYQLDPADQLAHLKWATTLQAMGQLDQAEAELRALLEKTPDYESVLRGQAHFHLGEIAEADDRVEEAMSHYQEAASRVEDSAPAHLGLARLFGRLGRFEDSAREFESAIEQAPDDVDARFGRATALILAERYTQARDALEQDLEVVPDAVPLRHALARLLAACPDPQVRDGKRALELALAVFQDRATLDHGQTVAMAYAEIGDYPHAVAWQGKVVYRAERTGQVDFGRTARRYLAELEAGQPIRSPWKDE